MIKAITLCVILPVSELDYNYLLFLSHSQKNYSASCFFNHANQNRLEPPYDKTNKVACAPSEDSDQPGHPPSLIWVFAVRINFGSLATHWAHSEDWSDWADAAHLVD